MNLYSSLPDALAALTPRPLLAQAHRLFTKTFEHPLFGAEVEFAPIEYLIQMSNPHFKYQTDTGVWDSPERLGFDALYADMLARGMRDPLLIGVGLQERKIRLETGNQRVRLYRQKGFTHLPVIAYVHEDSCITHRGNGEHEGILAQLKLPALGGILGPYPLSAYMRASSIIKDGPFLGVEPARIK